MTERRECPTCGRQVAFRTIREPRINCGRPIPPLQVPVPHRALQPDGTLGPPCQPGQRTQPSLPDVDHRPEGRGTKVVQVKEGLL
jgi:hypothetical protein